MNTCVVLEYMTSPVCLMEFGDYIYHFMRELFRQINKVPNICIGFPKPHLTIMALSTLKRSMWLLSISSMMYNTDTITLKLQFCNCKNAY